MDFSEFEAGFKKLGFVIKNNKVKNLEGTTFHIAYINARRCGFDFDHQGNIISFEKKFHFYEGHEEGEEEIEFFYDLLIQTGYNYEYAISIWEYAKSCKYYYSIFTLLDSNLHNDEAIEMNGRHYQTYEGELLLEGNQAKMYWSDLNHLKKIQEYENIIGGFWKEDGVFICFNDKCEMIKTSSKKEAFNFAV